MSVKGVAASGDDEEPSKFAGQHRIEASEDGKDANDGSDDHRHCEAKASGLNLLLFGRFLHVVLIELITTTRKTAH